MALNGPYTYRVAEADLAEAGRHYFQRRVFQKPMRYLFIAVILLAFVLVALDLYEDGALRLTTILLVVLGIPLIWLIPYLIAPIIMRRQYQQSAALRDENQIEFDNQAVQFSSRRGHARIPFEELFAWSETRTMILLHQTEAFFNPVPKDALGDDHRLLIAALEAAGIRRF